MKENETSNEINLEQDKKDFIDTLNVMNELAESFWDQGEDTRACLTEAQIYESASKILGKENPDTLKAMYNYALGLAKTHHDQEAADLLNEYVEIADKLEKTKKMTEKSKN